MTACSSMLLLAACGGGGGASAGNDVAMSIGAGQKAEVSGTPASTAGASKEKLSSVTAFDAASATKIASENNSFTLLTSATVYFGANGAFNARQLDAGTYLASNALFGDPAPNVYKAAYVVGTTAVTAFDPSKATRLAGEGGSFTLTASGIVFYGADKQFVPMQLNAGTYVANNTLFGDPAPGQYKAAFVIGSEAIIPFDVATATKIADENAQFTLTAAGTVYFGANGKFASKPLLAGTYYAGNALFGDPISGVAKSAYVVGTASIIPFDVKTAIRITGEGNFFTLTADATVFFGSGNSFTSKPLVAGTYQANNTLLGDPTPGVAKSVYVMGTSALTLFDASQGVKVAYEGQPFYLSAPARVFYGADKSFTSMQLAAGTYSATSTQFGDPISGAKAAYVIGTTSIPTFDASAASKVADEGQQFTIAYPSIIFFGAGSTFTARLLPAGTYTADSSIFADLVSGALKSAYILTNDDNGPRASTAPSITSQPQTAVVNGGQPATFGVSATSETIVSFQWARNGVAIPNATASTYALAATQLSDSGSRFSVAVHNNAGTTTSAAAALTVNAVSARVATAQRPFSDQSLWNSRPTTFTLGTFQIPASYYYPLVSEGDLSAAASVASATDGPVSVVGPVPGTGIYIADAEAFVDQITIPHWPAKIVLATGDDGHADIVDVASNKIHSFYKLRKDGAVWRASQYTWTALDGRGWGTPGQYFQGSRAAGVVPIAGLIRTAELTDGLPAYKHALAMSLSYTGLAANPTYTFPATAADIYASSVNSGGVPEGALMMLPADFDLSKIKDAKLLKVARTLQSYGAYVVDSSGSGTPFVIYVELGSGFSLMPNGWDNEIASQLDLLRSSMRQAVTTSNWVDANGAAFTPQKDLNLLSLRGSWHLLQGGTAGNFDTWDQAVTFADNGQRTVQLNASGRSMPSSLWGAPQPGRTYRLEVTSTGAATLQFTLVDGSGRSTYATAELGNGSAHSFVWPATAVTPQVRLTSGASGGGKIAATLIAQ